MIEQAVHDILTANTAVAALVGTRIRPLLAAELDARPFLTYHVTNDEPVNTMSGPSAYSTTTVEVGIYADSQLSNVQTCTAVQAALHHYHGTSGGERIAPSLLSDKSDLEQTIEPGQEQPVFMRVLTFRMLHKPSP